MIQTRNIFACISQSKRKRATAGSAPSRNLSLPILSTFAAAAFAVVFLAGAFMAMPAQAQTSPYSVVNRFTKGEGGVLDGYLVEDKKGDLFGLASGGGHCLYGVNNCGTIYELINNGDGTYTEQTLYDFKDGINVYPNANDGEGPTGGLAIDGNGDLFGVNMSGKVFELTVDPNNATGYAKGLTILAANIGLSPTGAIVYDSGNGNLYGTTYDGGSNNLGTVYQVNVKNKTAKTLHPFTGYTTPDGAYPIGGLIMHNGVLFGTTKEGGKKDFGTIFKIDPDGSHYSVLYSFGATSDGSFPEAALYADSNGDLFGTATSSGGTGRGEGTIFELKPPYHSSDFVTLYTFSGGAYTRPQGSLVFDSQGNLYGTASNGGDTATDCPGVANDPYEPTGCGAVYELSPDPTNTVTGYSSTLNVLHSFTNSGTNSDGAHPAYGLLLDSAAGKLFGITPVGGTAVSPSAPACKYDPYFLTYDQPNRNGSTCGTVFQVTIIPPLKMTSAKLKIVEGDTPGFELQSDLNYGGDFGSLTQTSQSVTLAVGSYYTVSIPAKDFQQLTSGHYAGSWVFSGQILDGAIDVAVSVQIDPPNSPDGDKKSESPDTEGAYEFKANAFPVYGLPTTPTPINVSISFGKSTGSETVTPSF